MQVQAKKSLGQNFLRDEAVLEKIVESADLKSDDFVIEIGPGEGVLTEKLSKKGGKVLAIELDDRLIPILNDKFRNKKNVEIFHGDILKINLNEFFSKHNMQDTRYKVVANLPYYITSPIIRYFLENENHPSEMILMVQKEVAQRIVAESGEMSILAVAVQYYAKAEYLFTVSKDAFEPAPKVDSAVIKISEINNDKSEDVKKFFQIVRTGFSSKRKTLANNLASSFQKDKKEIENILEEMSFSKMVRAQELSVEDWKKIQKYF